MLQEEDYQVKVEQTKNSVIQAIMQEFGNYSVSPGVIDMFKNIDISYVEHLPNNWSAVSSPENLSIKITNPGWGVNYGDILHEMIHLYSEISKLDFDRYNFSRTGKVENPKMGFIKQTFDPDTSKTLTEGRAINEAFAHLYTIRLGEKYNIQHNPNVYVPQIKIAENLENILGKDLLEKAFFSDKDDSAVSEKFDSILGSGSWKKLVNTMDNLEYDIDETMETIKKVNQMILNYHIISKQKESQIENGLGINFSRHNKNIDLKEDILTTVIKRNLIQNDEFGLRDLTVCNLASASIQTFSSKNTFMVADKGKGIFQFVSARNDTSEPTEIQYYLHNLKDISSVYDFKDYMKATAPYELNAHDEKIYNAIQKQYSKDNSKSILNKLKSKFSFKEPEPISIETFTNEGNEYAVVRDLDDKRNIRVYDVTGEKFLGREIIKPKVIEFDKETKLEPVGISKSKTRQQIHDTPQRDVPTIHKVNVRNAQYSR